MNDTVSNDFDKIYEWCRLNGVKFNAYKIQCCVINYRQSKGLAMSAVHINSINVRQAHTIDAHWWNNYVYKVLKAAFYFLGFYYYYLYYLCTT